MAEPIRIDIDDAELRALIDRLASAAAPGGLATPFAEIGEDLVDSTQRRFATGTAPDGTPWAPNSPATFASWLSKRTGITRKDGRLNARGAALAASKRPLIGDSLALSTQIFYQVEPDGLTVGSSRIYAAMMHFGGTRAEYPHLWGDIPARPFLGISDADRVGIVEVLNRHLAGGVGA